VDWLNLPAIRDRAVAGARGEPILQCSGRTLGVKRHRAEPHPLNRNSNPLTAFLERITPLGESDMIRDLPPPTEAEEYRSMAEILRDLAAQVRFGNTRSELVNLPDNLDRLADHSERRIWSR
jgi:hypothetical protein